MLTRAGFDLALSGYWSAALPASSNPARVNIFQSISAASDYHEKFLFIYISEDDSEIDQKYYFISCFNMNLSPQNDIYRAIVSSSIPSSSCLGMFFSQVKGIGFYH